MTDDYNEEVQAQCNNSEPLSITTPSIKPRRTYPPKSAAWETVVAELPNCFPGWHARALSRALRVRRTTVFNWMKHRCTPSLDQLDELAVIMKRIARAATTIAVSVEQEALDKRARPSSRGRGFLTVADHGDGLPPHNRQGHTLARLGLPVAKLGRPVTRTKKEPD